MESSSGHELVTPGDPDAIDIPLDVLGKDAGEFFKAHKFDECLARLYEIKKRKADDPKVLHNIGITEYYRDGCADPAKLLATLKNLKTRTEALASSVEEYLDGDGVASHGGGGGAPAGSSPTGAPGPGAGPGPSLDGGSGSEGGPSGSTAVCAEDYDTTIATVNIGSLLSQMQQYAQAHAALEPLYCNIEPIDEAAALHVCILLMDIALAGGRTDKAARVLAYVEKAFGYLLAAGDGGSSGAGGAESQPSTEVPGSAGVEHAAAASPRTPAEGSGASPPGGADDELGRDALDDGLEEEALSLSLELPESKRVDSSGAVSGSPARSKAAPAVTPELKLLLHLYKARLLILTRNLKATKREVKAALSMSRDHAQGLLLKAQLEYFRGNGRKAIRLLTASGSQSDPLVAAMVLSNLGCVHHRLGMQHTASLYFWKALERAAPSPQAQKGSKGRAPPASLALPLLYNAGLQQLLHGNPILAARCFQQAGALSYGRPLLWLRLAECCLVAYDRGLVGTNPVQWNGLKEKGVNLGIAGGGRWRRIVLQPGGLHACRKSLGINLLEEGLELEGHGKQGSVNTHAKASDSTPLAADGQGGGFLERKVSLAPGLAEEPSLEYARSCLQNALHLLDRQATAAAGASEVGDMNSSEPAGAPGGVADAGPAPSDKEAGSSASQSVRAPGSPAGPQGAREGKESKGPGGTALEAAASAALDSEKANEESRLRPWALASLAYTELCLANPLAALGAAEKLLACPGSSPPYSFLAHTYAAEALCWLDRPAEAADHLSTCMVEHAGSELAPVGLRDEDGQKWRSGDHSEASGDGEEGGSAGLAGPSLTGMPNLAELTGSSAQASLYVNLAAVYAMQGEALQAQQCALQALSIAPASPLPMLAVVYVELCRGHTQDALAMLKHCRHVRVARSNFRSFFAPPVHKAGGC